MNAKLCTRFPFWRIVVRGMAVSLLVLAALLGATKASRAQPMYGGGSYPPAYGQPNGVYYGTFPPLPQPNQRTPNVYYGTYQDNRFPVYDYSRFYSPVNNPSFGASSGAYNYVPSSNVRSYSSGGAPFTAPMPHPMTTQPPIYSPSTPAPSVQPPFTPIGSDPPDERKPAVPFHRPTNEKFWFKADYIATFIRPMRFSSPLVTFASPGDIPQGALGQPTTSVQFGDKSIDFDLFSSIRLEAGTFLDCDNRFSLELSGFWLPPKNQSYHAGSDLSLAISRPIYNVAAGREGAFLTSLPGAINGSIAVDIRSEMSNVELNARYHSYVGERLHADALFGFRYLRLAERMRIREHLDPVQNDFLTFQGNFVNAPDSLTDEDGFRTVNQFFGPQVGGRVSWEYGPFRLDGSAKLAIGGSRQQTIINGSTTLISANGNQTAAGGILAQPSNIGTHNRTVFGIVPEFGLNLGVDLNQHIRLNLGYSLLLWNHVVRPGSQYDHNVNPGQVPGSPTFGMLSGPISPAFRFQDEFFWTHTFCLGMEIHY